MALNVEEKYCISVDEAAAYSGIGENRLRDIIQDNPELPFIIWKDEQVVIHRKKFENWVMTLNHI